ncbi:MAG: hypothetical protein WAL47_09045, partial [Pyrinomonadaceae bacterium]
WSRDWPTVGVGISGYMLLNEKRALSLVLCTSFFPTHAGRIQYTLLKTKLKVQSSKHRKTQKQ